MFSVLHNFNLKESMPAQLYPSYFRIISSHLVRHVLSVIISLRKYLTSELTINLKLLRVP